MGIYIRTALKYILVAVLSPPVAGLFIFDAVLCIGEIEVPFIDQIGSAVFFVMAWALLVYWASRSPSIREAVARTCRAFALAAFLLPVASVVSAFTGPSAEHALIPPGAFIVICLILGGIMGILGWAASLLLSRDIGKAAEKDTFRPRKRTL